MPVSIKGKLYFVEPVLKLRSETHSGSFEIVEESGVKYLDYVAPGVLLPNSETLFVADDGREAEIEKVGQDGKRSRFRLKTELK